MRSRAWKGSASRGEASPVLAGVRLLDEHDRRVVVLKPEVAPQGVSPDFHPSPRPRGTGLSARALRALALTLIALGVLLLIDVGVTLVWQEPLSALYAKLRQDHLSGVLQKEERALPTPIERRALARLRDERARVTYLARALQRRAAEGSAVGRIVIPRLGMSFVVVKGTSTADLESGPGVYPETVFPGIAGTTAIAGHRTTYLAPFRHIDELSHGNRILLNMPYAHFTYRVTGSAVVAPTDVRPAVARVGYSRLVLSACTPLFTAAKRLLVFARLESITTTSGARIPGASHPRRSRRAVTHRAGPRPLLLST